MHEVNAGSRTADPEVGKYLLEAVGRWKSSSEANNSSDNDKDLAGAEQTEDDEGEQGVKKGLQDVLSVSYLSALVRTQAELSARLNLLA